MKSTPRRFPGALALTAPGSFALTLALMVAFSLTEGVGFLLLLPTLEAAGLNLAHQGSAGHYARLIDSVLARMGVPHTLLVLLGIFVLLVGARALLAAAQNLAAISVQQRFEVALRERLYQAIAQARWLFICRNRPSEFIHALTGEMERICAATWALLYLTADLIIAAIYIVVAMMLSVPMTLIVLAAAGLLALMTQKRMRLLEGAGREISADARRLHAATIEHVQTLKAALAYGAQARNFEIFSRLSRRLAASRLGAARYEASLAAFIDLGVVVVLGVVVYLAIKVVAVPAAAILVLLALFARVMPRFKSCHAFYRTFVAHLPSFSNVLALEARCRAESEPEPIGPREPLAMKKSLALEEVSFAYRPGGPPAVRAASLTIPAGAITAIVGPSGAGKSTIADLLMGLLEPDAGEVTVDAQTLRGARRRLWREQIGYVSADTFLFDGSVRANLRWARPSASEAEMREALKMAAADFVDALAHGLDTVIGERGAALSHGERQRLALARALLRRPNLLVLDEATNSLDSENESRVLSALERLRGRMTLVIIAHRLATIRCADLVYVVAGGEVVESGDCSTLFDRQGPFRTLFESQALA